MPFFVFFCDGTMPMTLPGGMEYSAFFYFRVLSSLRSSVGRSWLLSFQGHCITWLTTTTSIKSSSSPLLLSPHHQCKIFSTMWVQFKHMLQFTLFIKSPFYNLHTYIAIYHKNDMRACIKSLNYVLYKLKNRFVDWMMHVCVCFFAYYISLRFFPN